MTSEKGRIGYAVIGSGIGRLHARAINELGDRAELRAVYSIFEEDARRFAEETGAPKHTSNVEEILNDPDVDAISLAVPPNVHKDLTVAALKAGKHVLVEKPMAMRVSEADAMIVAAREAGRTLAVGQNQRFFEHYARARALLNEGVIGTPFLLVANVHVFGAINGFRTRLADAGGGTLIDSGIHKFDLMRWMLGDVTSVYALGGNFVQPQMEGEDTAAVSLHFASGAIGSFTCTWSGLDRRSVESIQIFGTNGSLIAEDHTQSLHVHVDPERGDAGRSGDWAYATDQAGAIKGLVADFLDAIENDRPPVVNGDEGRASLAIVEAAYTSIATGKVCDV